MYETLDLFKTAGSMARHAGARQAITARNVANADTPGYQAQTIPSFADSFDQTALTQMRRSQPNHFGGLQSAHKGAAEISRTEPSPNGNTVSIEEEMLNAVGISREHNRALMVYRHTMTVLRTTLGR